MRITALAVVALGTITGCTWLNAPDPDLLVDAGMDGGGVDAGFDGGPDSGDAGPPDACVPGGDEFCEDGEDNNCDGLVDCADFACARLSVCCESGGELLAGNWSAFNTRDWNGYPDDLAPRVSAGWVTSFGDPCMGPGGALTDCPRGLVSELCQPLAVGARITVELKRVSQTCAEGCYAGLVLTPAEGVSARGQPILRDLAVLLDNNGQLRVLNADRVLGETGSTIAGADEPVEVTIDINPGQSAGGTPELHATVEAYNRSTTERVKVLEDEAFIDQDALVDWAANCNDVGGLYVAVEGAGQDVQVGPLVVSSLECVNPGRFEDADRDVLSRSAGSLPFGIWGGGGIGHPTLGSSGDGWDLLVDGTDVSRDSERVSDIGFSIGHAQVAMAGWNGDWSGPASAPRLGSCHPSCVTDSPAWGCGGSACPGGLQNLREPSLFIETNMAGSATGLYVVYASSATATAFGIGGEQLNADAATSAVPRPNTPFLMPADVECDSLRDPSLIPRSAMGASEGFWLLYTCELDATAERARTTEIHAIQVDFGFVPRPATKQILLQPDIGPYAAGGVRGPEALVEFHPSDANVAIYRIWFTARDARGMETTIAMAQGQTSAEDTLQVLPTMIPFPSNPVLRLGDPLVGCGADCDYLGMAVSRVPGSTTALRFLVARKVDATGMTELVPLEQFWRSPW